MVSPRAMLGKYTHGDENLGPGALMTSSERENTVAPWCLSTILQKSRLVQYLSYVSY